MRRFTHSRAGFLVCGGGGCDFQMASEKEKGAGAGVSRSTDRHGNGAADLGAETERKII